MKRTALAILVPPLAVCRYGCAGYCAAPIGVFWLAGIISIIYGFHGGPLEGSEFSWATLILGIVLWAIASIWARVVIKNVNEDTLRSKSSLCRVVDPGAEDQDPFDGIHKNTH